jgi:hypothetical protein
MKRFATLAVALLFVLAASGVTADDVLDSIDEGAQAYKDGNYQEAVSSLEFAMGLIRDLQVASLADALPSDVPGYTSEDVEGSSMPAAFMGGGMSVSRRYSKDASKVTITLIANSPMLSSMSMMMGAMAQAPNTKRVRIKGNKGTLKWEAGRRYGELNLMLLNSMLVKVEGNQVDGPEVVQQFAEAVDYKMLKLFLTSQ